MENRIFEQMKEIIKDENMYGTIILIDSALDKDRAIGKTYNLVRLAELYGLKFGKRYTHPPNGNRLSTNEDSYRGRVIGDDSVYILDEGFTLEEIDMLKKYHKIAFALVDINNLGDNFVKIRR